jgi:hypothetical protein
MATSSGGREWPRRRGATGFTDMDGRVSMLAAAGAVVRHSGAFVPGGHLQQPGEGAGDLQGVPDGGQRVRRELCAALVRPGAGDGAVRVPDRGGRVGLLVVAHRIGAGSESVPEPAGGDGRRHARGGPGDAEAHPRRAVVFARGERGQDGAGAAVEVGGGRPGDLRRAGRDGPARADYRRQASGSQFDWRAAGHFDADAPGARGAASVSRCGSTRW